MTVLLRMCATLLAILPGTLSLSLSSNNSQCFTSDELENLCGEYANQFFDPMLIALSETSEKLKIKDRKIMELEEKIINNENDRRKEADRFYRMMESHINIITTIQNKFDRLEREASDYKKQIDQFENRVKTLDDEISSCKRNLTIQVQKVVSLEETKRIVLINNTNILEPIESYSEYSSCATARNYSGLLTVKLKNLAPFVASCDSKLAGSGWTVIQRRFDGSVSFNRNWREYKQGFGNVDGEFFIGLEKLHQMTKAQRHELYIHLVDKEDQVRFARYENFVVESESKDYELSSVGEFTGNAGNSLCGHRGSKFSTPDRDNDKWRYNCAGYKQGGWWYFYCTDSDLNAYNWGCNKKGESDGDGCIHWHTWHDRGYSLKAVQMMIRPWEAK